MIATPTPCPAPAPAPVPAPALHRHQRTSRCHGALRRDGVRQPGTEGSHDRPGGRPRPPPRSTAYRRPRARCLRGRLRGCSGVITRLQDRGYTVIAPANPLRGVATDSAYSKGSGHDHRADHPSSATPTAVKWSPTPQPETRMSRRWSTSPRSRPMRVRARVSSPGCSRAANSHPRTSFSGPSHVAMVSHPAVVTKLILAASRATR